ncbi:MAG: hypothetical protein K6B65_04015 [Bacilli bacterium]|nr:hypothetical protein [Bacilli bacterium]
MATINPEASKPIIKVDKIQSTLKEELLGFFMDPNLEIGGFLGSKDGEVVELCLDQKGIKENRSYFPSITYLNTVDRGWKKKGISFLGFFHSHINGFDRLSTSDKAFFLDFLSQNKDVPYMICPLLYERNKEKIISWFYIGRDRIEEITLNEY